VRSAGPGSEQRWLVEDPNDRNQGFNRGRDDEPHTRTEDGADHEIAWPRRAASLPHEGPGRDGNRSRKSEGGSRHQGRYRPAEPDDQQRRTCQHDRNEPKKALARDIRCDGFACGQWLALIGGPNARTSLSLFLVELVKQRREREPGANRTPRTRRASRGGPTAARSCLHPRSNRVMHKGHSDRQPWSRPRVVLSGIRGQPG
jgi:hypothetical protein